MPVLIEKQVPRYYLGLDVSTKAGYCLIKNGELKASGVVVRKPNKDNLGDWDVLAAHDIASTLAPLVDHNTVVAIEHYAFGGHGLTKLVEVGTLVRLMLAHSPALRVMEVAPGTLKKFTCGKGNAKKDMMRLRVFKRWGFEDDSDDVVDAYALARYAEADDLKIKA